jgi:beta-lactamase superfamily II metal-dependent hydrolase
MAKGWSAPADDELEVIVFGRGDGESIALHLGHGRWMVVDSCLDADERPAALTYLESLDVDPATAIRLVVVSHWDSDHVGGVSKLFEAAEAADFACASTLQDRELVELIRERGEPQAEPKRTIDHFASVFETLRERGRSVVWGVRGTVLWEEPDVRVWSLAPSGAVHTRSLIKLIENTPPGADVKTDRRNYLSMVLWIEAGDHQRILIGGDLEKRPRRAWDAVVESPGRRGELGHVFKVPHHGSETGYRKRVWDEMLVPQVPAAVTAFKSSSLPTQKDRARLLRATRTVYLAGDRAEAPPRSEDTRQIVTDSTASGGTTPLTGPLGRIRLRAKLDSSDDWAARCCGNAVRL